MSPDLHHLSGAYAVDALDRAERESFEQHLAVCADCRAEVAELAAAAQHLSSVTETPPPPALRAAVLEGITRVRPLPPVGEEGDDRATEDAAVAADDQPGATVVPFVRRRSTWLAAAAAAIAIAAGGIAWGQWSDPASPVDQVVAAADAMRVTGTKGPMTAEVAYSRQLGKGAITVTGMPPAPDGKVYQLWYVGADGVARSAGIMAPEDGRGAMVLQGDPNSAAAVGVTVEPAGGSPSPTTEPVVVLPLA